jgi:hypothetical protein
VRELPGRRLCGFGTFERERRFGRRQLSDALRIDVDGIRSSNRAWLCKIWATASTSICWSRTRSVGGIDNDCVYRKLKLGRSDGEAHRGSGVNEWIRMDGVVLFDHFDAGAMFLAIWWISAPSIHRMQM